MSRIALISSADATYYPLLVEWIANMQALPNTKGMDICILDVGMTPEQRAVVESRVAKVIEPDWPVKPPRFRSYKPFMRACVCRPYLPDLFPGYDLYFWMDADTWVQNPVAIDWFIKGGLTKKMTVTNQADRAYPRSMRLKWVIGLPLKVRGFYFTNALKAFGLKTARAIYPYHVVLAGAFCLHKDAPHWKQWQKRLGEALKKGRVFTAEQLSLGVMIHLDKYPAEILPAWMHWLCEHKPLWNAGTGRFVEPYLPHNEIGILHLSGVDEMRLNRSVTQTFTTTDGKTIDLSYRYPLYDGERDTATALSSAA